MPVTNSLDANTCLQLLTKTYRNFTHSYGDYLHRGCPNLVITIGDSWTWGDSLGKTETTQDNKEYRIKHVYGNCLANKLQADFINLGVCGASNEWIFETCNRVLDIANTQKEYSNIYLILTLTETGRELSDKISDKFMPVLKNNPDDFFLSFEHSYAAKLESLSAKCAENVKFIVGKNFAFVSPILSKLPYVITKQWTTYLAEIQNYPPVNAFMVTQMGYGKVDEMIQTFDNTLWTAENKYKKWFFRHVIKPAESMTDFLEWSKLNYQYATKHPTEQGHQIWADIIYQFIKEKYGHFK